MSTFPIQTDCPGNNDEQEHIIINTIGIVMEIVEDTLRDGGCHSKRERGKIRTKINRCVRGNINHPDIMKKEVGEILQSEFERIQREQDEKERSSQTFIGSQPDEKFAGNENDSEDSNEESFVSEEENPEHGQVRQQPVELTAEARALADFLALTPDQQIPNRARLVQEFNDFQARRATLPRTTPLTPEQEMMQREREQQGPRGEHGRQSEHLPILPREETLPDTGRSSGSGRQSPRPVPQDVSIHTPQGCSQIVAIENECGVPICNLHLYFNFNGSQIVQTPTIQQQTLPESSMVQELPYSQEAYVPVEIPEEDL